MKLGAIYVNGWAVAENPNAVGAYIGRGELLHWDGTRSKITRNRAIVETSVPWGEDMRSCCRRALEERHAAAKAYALEILWPAEYDAETKDRIWRKEYTPPSFAEWEASR